MKINGQQAVRDGWMDGWMGGCGDGQPIVVSITIQNTLRQLEHAGG
jgi:hypothetical protein